MKRLLIFSLLVSLSFSSYAANLPELASLPQLWGLGLFLGALFYFTARYRWWLALPMLPLSLMYIGPFFKVWNNPEWYAQVLKNESGFYLFNWFMTDSMLIIGLILGAFFNIKAMRLSYLLKKEEQNKLN